MRARRRARLLERHPGVSGDAAERIDDGTDDGDAVHAAVLMMLLMPMQVAETPKAEEPPMVVQFERITPPPPLPPPTQVRRPLVREIVQTPPRTPPTHVEVLNTDPRPVDDFVEAVTLEEPPAIGLDVEPQPSFASIQADVSPAPPYPAEDGAGRLADLARDIDALYASDADWVSPSTGGPEGLPKLPPADGRPGADPAVDALLDEADAEPGGGLRVCERGRDGDGTMAVRVRLHDGPELGGVEALEQPADVVAHGAEVVQRDITFDIAAGEIFVIGTTGDPATPFAWAEALSDQLGAPHAVPAPHGAQHVGRGEQPGQEVVVGALRRRDERPVRERDAQQLGLGQQHPVQSMAQQLAAAGGRAAYDGFVSSG